MRKRCLALGLGLMLCIVAVGCASTPDEARTVVVRIKCPPLTMAYDAAHPHAEICTLFQEAAKKFSAQYKRAQVRFIVEKFQYADEKERVMDRVGTDGAADILVASSFHLPAYLSTGRLATWDEIIDQELRGDVDEAIWRRCMANGRTYLMPYFRLQNNLLVNAQYMRSAGLERYIPPPGRTAQWSTAEFNAILQALKASMLDRYTFPLFAYAANHQGDIHTLTLLRAYGCRIFNEKGEFTIATPEGVRALEWLRDLEEQRMLPKGAENLEWFDNMALFYHGQMAICAGSQVNWHESRNVYHLEVFPANFPSLDGSGYVTDSLQGFMLFDNGDPEVIRAARDYIRFIYDNEELLRYALSGAPVLNSYAAKHEKALGIEGDYGEDPAHIVDFLYTPNGEGVRAAFYPHMQALYRGGKTPQETADAIDRDCNAALREGLRLSRKKN